MDQKLKEKIDEGYILCRTIVEVAGTPKSHIEKTMQLVIETIKKSEGKDLILKSCDIFKAKEVELKEVKEKGKLFSTYTEMEILFKNIPKLIGFCFDYMPSSLEILEPKGLNLDTNHFANLLNDLLAHLHKADMVLKGLRAENQILNENASNLLRNLIIIALSGKPKTLKEIAKITGIGEEHLGNFVKEMNDKRKIKLEGEKYSLNKYA